MGDTLYMNIFKELKRVKRYKSLKPWLQQNGVVSVTWEKTIKVDIQQLNKNNAKSMYLPTFSNGRKVDIHVMSTFEFYDNLCSSVYSFYYGS